MHLEKQDGSYYEKLMAQFKTSLSKMKTQNEEITMPPLSQTKVENRKE